MEYERLTIKRHDKNYIKTPVDGVHDFLVITNRVGKYEYTTGEVIDRLAELEDKIENGTLYNFPFRIGQEVYIACDWDIRKAVKGTITEIELTTNKNGTFHRVYVDHEYIFSKTNPNVVKYRYIFTERELFLTRAEAEKKLLELRGEV